MEAEEVLHIMRATAPAANLEDAAAFLELCRERGLTPFIEASPIVMDYVKRDGTRVHSLSVKEHYAVAERWAQQCGGYTVRLREIIKDGSGDIRARVGIVSNRDYVAIIQLCTRVPGVDFKEELASFMVIGEATLSAEEQRKPSPKGKSWEWLAEKRARESAIIQKFGREPSQSRQMYAQAITAQAREVDTHETQALLYGAPPALSVAPEPPAPVSLAPVPPEPQEPLESEPEPASEPESIAPEPAPVPAHWAEDEQTRRKFWAWATSQGLSKSDVHTALGVDSISLFKGDKKAAIDRITAWIAAQTTSATPVESSLDPEPASESELAAFEPEPAAPTAEPQDAPKSVPATLAEARVEWSKAWNIAKRLGLNPPLLDNKWSIEEIMMNIAILEVEISEATAASGASNE